MPHASAATPLSVHHRPRWWTELPLIVVVYALYSAGRLQVQGNAQSAVEHGLAILHLEKALFLNAEHPLNRLFTTHPGLGVPADFAYASLHYLVTPAVLIWMFRRRSAAYRAARTWLMTATLLALVGFTLMPTCPPRLLAARHGFVDTMAQYSSYGWWGTGASAPRGFSGMTNQYAAMPSLHVGWALWCGILLWRHGRHPLIRAAGIAYPLIITVIVMGTANHYFLDALAGAAVVAVGALLTRPVMRLSDRIRDRIRAARAPVVAAVGATRSPIVSAGCKTSAGERIPGRRTYPAALDAASGDAPARDMAASGAAAGDETASDDAPAAAR